MENVINRIDARLVNSKKSKPSYKSQKMFDNDLVTIRKIKVTFKLNKPACVGM